MSEVMQELAHFGPRVPKMGSDRIHESGGTDHWRSYGPFGAMFVTDP